MNSFSDLPNTTEVEGKLPKMKFNFPNLKAIPSLSSIPE